MGHPPMAEAGGPDEWFEEQDMGRSKKHKNQQYVEEWKEFKDQGSSTNYYEGRIPPFYKSSTMTPLGIILILLGLAALVMVGVFESSAYTQGESIFVFIFQCLEAAAIPIVMIAGGFLITRKGLENRRESRKAATLPTAPTPVSTVSTPVATEKSKAEKGTTPKRNLFIRYAAILLMVVYFLPSYAYPLLYGYYGISAEGMTIDKYGSLHLGAYPILAILLLIPAVMLLVSFLKRVARFEGLVAVVLSVLYIAMLFVFQVCIDQQTITEHGPSRWFGFYISLLVCLFLIGHVLFVRIRNRSSRRSGS